MLLQLNTCREAQELQSIPDSGWLPPGPAAGPRPPPGPLHPSQGRHRRPGRRPRSRPVLGRHRRQGHRPQVSSQQQGLPLQQELCLVQHER
jgi:hypothetical protein